MRDKINHLRKVAASDLKDAESATNQREATRLVMRAARLQEQIFELEEMTAGRNADPDSTT
jgi:hypothetical protein